MKAIIPPMTRQQAAELVAEWEECQGRADGAEDEHDIADAMVDLLRVIADMETTA